MFREPGGADWQHPAAMSHEQGVDGKDVQVRDRVWALVTVGLVRAPCSCSANTKIFTFPPQLPSLNLFKGELWVKRDKLKPCWSSCEVSSWRCHLCLHGAVISSTSYLLWAHTVIILATRPLCFPEGPLPSQFLPCTPLPPPVWQMIHTSRCWLALLCKHVTPAGYR